MNVTFGPGSSQVFAFHQITDPNMFDRAVHGILFSILIFLPGCSSFGDRPDFGRDIEVAPVAVQTFEVKEQSGLSITFGLTGEWRNTCGEFSRVEASRERMTYSVTMYGQQPIGVVCGDAFTPISGEWSTTVPAEGTYTFEFQRNDAAPIDTTLTFVTE